MSEATGRDLKPLFESFVVRRGVPLLAVELSCTGTPTLKLEQRRYVPTGSSIEKKQTWTMPVCARWSAGGKTGHDCALLSAEQGELPLSAPSCPDWVLPNE